MFWAALLAVPTPYAPLIVYGDVDLPLLLPYGDSIDRTNHLARLASLAQLHVDP
jgi:hypothetical protein